MGCFMPKSVVWHKITSKQDRHFIGLFWAVILFNSLNVNTFFLFVCLSNCKCCVSDTLAGDFFFRTVDVSRESRGVPPTLWFSRKKIEIIFRGRCRPRKLKSAKNNPHVFETKPQKFGDAKISYYTVSWRLFDVWTLYFVIMSQCNAAFALKQCRSRWSRFSWSSDFALYLK